MPSFAVQLDAFPGPQLRSSFVEVREEFVPFPQQFHGAVENGVAVGKQSASQSLRKSLRQMVLHRYGKALELGDVG